MIFKNIICGISLIGLLTLFPFFGNAMEVTCSVKTASGKTGVEFNGISGEFDSNDYSEKGVLTLSAIVTGKGKKLKTNVQARYKKVGSRLELGYTWITLGEKKEIEDHIGRFPEVECTSP